jgi:hypothetical protein
MQKDWPNDWANSRFSRLFYERAYKPISHLTNKPISHLANKPISHLTTKKNLNDTEKIVSDEKNVTATWLLCIQTLLPWRNKCFNANGDYVEVWCVVSAALCHAHTEVRIHFSASLYVLYFVTSLYERRWVIIELRVRVVICIPEVLRSELEL